MNCKNSIVFCLDITMTTKVKIEFKRAVVHTFRTFVGFFGVFFYFLLVIAFYLYLYVFALNCINVKELF